MARRKRDAQGAFVERHDSSKAPSNPLEDTLYVLGDPPEFVLVPLLATDPLPYLFDQDGEDLDAEGERLSADPPDPVSAAVRKLQNDARPAPSCKLTRQR